MVEEYWRAALERLRAEVDGFSSLVSHNAEMGHENEVALARLLTGLAPGYVQIGSGMLIDSTGAYSKQTDLVFFDAQDEPTIFAQTTQLPFPVEAVLAAAEVKTNLSIADLSDVCDKTKAIRSLAPVQGRPTPHSIVVAYGTSVAPKTMLRHFSECTAEERPDLVCILNPGLVGFSNGSSTDGFELGLAVLTDSEDSTVLVQPSDEKAKYNTHEGHQYPVIPAPDKSVVLSDPAWALLMFLDRLVAELASRTARPLPIFSSYVRKAERSLRQYEIDD